jgi:energy-converting hydrogenase Eha subunit A
MAYSSQTLVFAVLAPLIVWRIYSRTRRMVGRQKSSPRRQWATIILFPLVIVMLGYTITLQQNALIAFTALLGGMVCGGLLGYLGNRLTRFEHTAEGLFYTPNAHLGIALSLLLFARIAYRFTVTGLPNVSPGPGPTTPVNSPLTLILFGMLASYYVSYAVGLLLWRRAALRSGPVKIDN